MTQRLCSDWVCRIRSFFYIKGLFRLLVRGPCILCSPLECVRRKEWKAFARVPRTLYKGKGGKDQEGLWRLQCAFVTFDGPTKWFDFDLLHGHGRLDSAPEKTLEDTTPPDSPPPMDFSGRVSVRHQSRNEKQAVRKSVRQSRKELTGEEFVLGRPRTSRKARPSRSGDTRTSQHVPRISMQSADGFCSAPSVDSQVTVNSQSTEGSSQV